MNVIIATGLGVAFVIILIGLLLGKINRLERRLSDKLDIVALGFINTNCREEWFETLSRIGYQLDNRIDMLLYHVGALEDRLDNPIENCELVVEAMNDEPANIDDAAIQEALKVQTGLGKEGAKTKRVRKPRTKKDETSKG